MESCDYKVCGGDSIPFAQWSPETLGAGFVLPFALTNSGRLPSALPTGETLPSFAAAFWSRIRGFGFPTEQCEFSPFSPGCAMKSPEFPKISGFFHAIFKVGILPFRLILKVQFGVQPGRLQHSPGHALPFGQSCTPSNSLILLFFSSTRALERPYIRSTSFASRMNLSTSSYDSSKP